MSFAANLAVAKDIVVVLGTLTTISLGLYGLTVWKRDLERLTKPLNVSPADEYAGKREECLMDIGTALVADA